MIRAACLASITLLVGVQGCTGLVIVPPEASDELPSEDLPLPPGGSVSPPGNPPPPDEGVTPPPSFLQVRNESITTSYSGFLSVGIDCFPGQSLQVEAPDVEALDGGAVQATTCVDGTYRTELYLPAGVDRAVLRFSQPDMSAGVLEVEVQRRALPSTYLALFHEQVSEQCLGCHSTGGPGPEWGSMENPAALLDFVYREQGRGRFPALASVEPPRDLRADPGTFLRRIVHRLGEPSPVFAGAYADAGSMPPVGSGERARLEMDFGFFDLAYAVLAHLPAASAPPEVDACLGQTEPVELIPVTRLTNDELHLTVQSLYALPAAFPQGAENPLPAATGEVSTFVSGLGFPALPPGTQDTIFEDLLIYADGVAAAFDAARYNQAFQSGAGCALNANSGNACVRRHIEQLLQRAYRGEAVPSETVDFVVSVYGDFRQELAVPAAFVQATSKFLVVNPFFLFKSFRGEDSQEAGGVRPLTNLELATRISYLFWGSGPEPSFLERDWNRLLRGQSAQDASERERVLQEILTDPRSDYFLRTFGFQWLHVNYELSTLLTEPLASRAAELQAAIDGELLQMLRHVVTERRPIDELLTADYTFLNRTLAEWYGIDPSSFGDNFERVSFSQYPELANRRGILTQAKLLSGGSMPSRPSAANRGTRILRHIICSPMGPPSGFVIGQNDGNGVDPETITEAQRFRSFTESPSTSCAGCHLRINPVGFPFHAFDRLGRHDISLAVGGSLPEPAVYENVVVRGESTNNPSAIWKAQLFYLDDRGGSLSDLPTPDGSLTGRFDDHLGLIDLLASTRAFEACVVEHLYDHTGGFPSSSPLGRDTEVIEAHACSKSAMVEDAPDLLALLGSMVSRPGFTSVRRD